MFTCQPFLNDYEMHAVKTYEQDVIGLAEEEAKAKTDKEAKDKAAEPKHKYGHLTINKKLTPVALWSAEEREAKLREAEGWYKKLSTSRTALVIATLAAIILLAFSVCASPVLSCAAISFSAVAAGAICVGLFIVTIYLSNKLQPYAKQFGEQHVLHAQNHLKATLNPALPKEARQKYAKTVATAFQKYSLQDQAKAIALCEKKIRAK